MATRDEERERGKQPGVKTPEVPHVPKPEPEMPGRQGRTGMEEPNLPTPGPEVGGRAPRDSGVAEMPRPTEKPGP
jgi:hypothetical protein